MFVRLVNKYDEVQAGPDTLWTEWAPLAKLVDQHATGVAKDQDRVDMTEFIRRDTVVPDDCRCKAAPWLDYLRDVMPMVAKRCFRGITPTYAIQSTQICESLNRH
eukprot:54428-Eustigmatos_ZCMA.PRE.1